MLKTYGIYAQGARITLDDFDPRKVIPYLFRSYDMELSDQLMDEIQNNSVSDAHFDELCEKLRVEPDERTMQGLCSKALYPDILEDMFVDDAEERIGNEMISAWLYENIDGIFEFDNEDRPSEHICGTCMMLCFDVPYVWDIQDAIIPVNRRLAVFQLQQASKLFLKDEIDWKSRLGNLIAVGQSI